MSEVSSLAAAFGQREPTYDPRFTTQVMHLTRQQRWRRNGMRALKGLVLFLVCIPLQDVALAFGALAMVELVEIEHQLAATLLAPVNSLGGVLTFVLLVLRFVHGRLFS